MFVHRRAVDLVQRSSRQRLVDLTIDEQLEPAAAETAELNAERLRVRNALAELPAKQRAALELAYYGGFTQAQIATHLGLPLGTVKSQLFHGLRRLGQLLLGPAELHPAPKH